MYFVFLDFPPSIQTWLEMVVRIVISIENGFKQVLGLDKIR